MKLRPPPPFAPRPRDEQFLAVVTWQRIHLADEKLHEIFDTLDTDGLGVEKPCVVQLFTRGP